MARAEKKKARVAIAGARGWIGEGGAPRKFAGKIAPDAGGRKFVGGLGDLLEQLFSYFPLIKVLWVI